MTDTSGPMFCEPFVHYDPDSSCWRTSEATFPWGSDEFSETWPKRGSMRNGVCYERQMSAPHTDVPECSSLLATPMAHERTFTPRAVHHGVQLANQVAALLPTPTARDGKAGLDYRDRTQDDDLYQAAARIGGHMNPRSGDGNESSDVQLPFH